MGNNSIIRFISGFFMIISISRRTICSPGYVYWTARNAEKDTARYGVMRRFEATGECGGRLVMVDGS